VRPDLAANFIGFGPQLQAVVEGQQHAAAAAARVTRLLLSAKRTTAIECEAGGEGRGLYVVIFPQDFAGMNDVKHMHRTYTQTQADKTCTQTQTDKP